METNKDWGGGRGQGKRGSPGEGRGGSSKDRRQPCIFPMPTHPPTLGRAGRPQRGLVVGDGEEGSHERYGGSNRKRDARGGGEGATCVRGCGPGPPDSIDAPEGAPMQQGERVMREAGSPLLKGKKRVEPKLAARGSGDKQGEKHPPSRSTLLAPLSPAGSISLGAPLVRSIAWWGERVVRV